MITKRAIFLTAILLLSSVFGQALAQKNKHKEKRYEPVALRDVRDSEGKYVGIEDSYFIDIHVTSDGAMNITVYEAGRRATLKDIRLEGAIITASKVFEDGGTGSFSGVFANRILNGRSAFGIIVDNLHIEMDGFMLNGLFFKLSETTNEHHSAVESNVVLARSEIEARHAEMAAAIEVGDLDSLQTLRTENFLTVMPDGEVRTGEQSNLHMRTMLRNAQPPIQISSAIDQLILIDDEAIAVVRKEFSGTQDYLGRLCVVRTSVSLRETWTRTYDGWKLKMVDNIRYLPTLVDGQPLDQTAEGLSQVPMFEVL
jgi:hypothetical protein